MEEVGGTRLVSHPHCRVGEARRDDVTRIKGGAMTEERFLVFAQFVLFFVF